MKAGHFVVLCPMSQYDDDMNKDAADLQQWAGGWHKAEAALQRIRAKELQDFDMESNADLVDAMLQAACEHSQPRLHTGLVEQQRLFSRFRQRTP